MEQLFSHGATSVQVNVKSYDGQDDSTATQLIKKVWELATKAVKSRCIGVLDATMEDNTHLYIISCSSFGQTDLVTAQPADFANKWANFKSRTLETAVRKVVGSQDEYKIAPVGPSTQCYRSVPPTTPLSHFPETDQKAYREEIKNRTKNRRDVLRKELGFDPPLTPEQRDDFVRHLKCTSEQSNDELISLLQHKQLTLEQRNELVHFRDQQLRQLCKQHFDFLMTNADQTLQEEFFSILNSEEFTPDPDRLADVERKITRTCNSDALSQHKEQQTRIREQMDTLLSFVTYTKLTTEQIVKLEHCLKESVFGAKFKSDNLPENDFEILIDWHKDLIEKPFQYTEEQLLTGIDADPENAITRFCTNEDNKIVFQKLDFPDDLHARLMKATNPRPQNREELVSRCKNLGLDKLEEKLNSYFKTASGQNCKDVILQICGSAVPNLLNLSRIADYYAQCAEDNATIELVKYCTNGHTKKVKSVDWISTIFVDEILDKPLCPVCAIRFKDRLKYLLDHIYL